VTTAERGYGYGHQRLRKSWAPRVERGEVACACGCGWPILPGQAWDLGHDPHDPTGQRYLGPMLAAHNRNTTTERRLHRRRRRRYVNPEW